MEVVVRDGHVGRVRCGTVGATHPWAEHSENHEIARATVAATRRADLVVVDNQIGHARHVDQMTTLVRGVVEMQVADCDVGRSSPDDRPLSLDASVCAAVAVDVQGAVRTVERDVIRR